MELRRSSNHRSAMRKYESNAPLSRGDGRPDTQRAPLSNPSLGTTVLDPASLESIQCRSLATPPSIDRLERNAMPTAPPSPNIQCRHIMCWFLRKPSAYVPPRDGGTNTIQHGREGWPYLKSKCNGRDALVGERRARSQSALVRSLSFTGSRFSLANRRRLR